MVKQKIMTGKRKGIVDVWNAFMVKGATFDDYDIPICHTTAKSLPRQLISWREAKTLHNKEMQHNNKNYHVEAFIHFYVDDVKFDGVKSSIWLFPWEALKIIQHFEGVITPDFSTYQDFPEPIKIFATYQMRALGFWLGSMGIQVINNVRWGTAETWKYSFKGIPKHSLVAIGSSASELKKKMNMPLFEDGLMRMIEELQPMAIIVYGSANYQVFQDVRKRGIEIIQFDSERSVAYAKEVRNEQNR